MTGAACLVILLGANVARAAGGNDCSAPTIIDALPFADFGDTSVAGTTDTVSILSGGCYFYEVVAAKDHVYQITLGESAHIRVALNNVGAGWDAIVYILSSCNDGLTACVAAQDDIWNPGIEVIEDAPYPPGTYYIWVDSYYASGHEGYYELYVSGELVGPHCGDGLINNDEDCDGDGAGTGGETATCDTDCTLVTCGDATVNAAAGEVCDDGLNDGSYGGCVAGCSDLGPYCGDDTIDGFAGESCDDGNNADGDGCSADCLVEGGVCGDAVLNVGETCDDGVNDGAYGGCLAGCGGLAPFCGDATVDAGDGEACDDGNVVDDGNGCSDTCTRLGSCGDGTVQSYFEDCDGSAECTPTCVLVGSRCGAPFELASDGDLGDGSFAWAGDSTTYSAELDAPCSPSSGGRDAVARFVAPAAGDYRFWVEAGFDVVLWVWDQQCDPSASPLACGDAWVLGYPESVTVTLTAGQEVFVIVDGYGTGAANRGPFTLWAASEACGDGIVTLGEYCDDGVNDGSYGGCLPGCAGWASYCGDGVVDAADGEVCDEVDNDGSYDGCLPDCMGLGPHCGDGVLDATAGEVCDDGVNDGSYDGCGSLCRTLPARCGDGELDADQGEACDDGTNDGGYGSCAADCQSLGPHCGDGAVDAAAGETCDDGNLVDADGCNAACLLEGGSCGDAVRNAGEACDDGTNDGAYGGCAVDCAARAPRCGDGVVDDDHGETCDDWLNTGAYGSCLPDCSAAAAHCGDGNLDTADGELCDDGVNDGNYDGCAFDCRSLAAYCGDGTIDAAGPESCDDGAAVDGDGCSADCRVEGGACGDAVLNSGEACDDGVNDGSYAGCNAGCGSWGPRCGDGAIDADDGESCDDAVNDGGYGGCASDCSGPAPSCGDGTVDAAHGEVCDDGNTDDGDGCAADCASDESCGNGSVDLAEICDDGNTAGNDGCSGDCLSDESCGNGYKDLVEDCDDGGTAAGDGCAADCTFESNTGGDGGSGGDAGGGGDGGSGGDDGDPGGCSCSTGRSDELPVGGGVAIAGYLLLGLRQLRRRRRVT